MPVRSRSSARTSTSVPSSARWSRASRSILRAAGCSVSIGTNALVIGRWDPSRLDRVVTNLLSNAMKFGAGKPIEITVGGEGDRARLVVRDHGIGIASEQRYRIFGRFERAVSESRYGGLGLGLYISQRIVHDHGGSIWCESQAGAGATFIVELPCARARRAGKLIGVDREPERLPPGVRIRAGARDAAPARSRAGGVPKARSRSS